MSVAVVRIEKSELPFAAEIVLADTVTGEELPLRVAETFLRERSINVGDVISDGEAEETVEAARILECAISGLKLLAYTDNSVRGLGKKLRSRGYDRDCAEGAADLLSELGYINESAQIERRGRALAERKLRGRRRVTADLAAMGYDRDRIGEWVRDCGIDFSEICARAIEKKGGIPPRDDPDGRRRLMQYLYRQGFGSEDIRAAAVLLAKNDE